MHGGYVAAINGDISKQGWLAMWSWRPSQQFHLISPCCKINLPCSGLCYPPKWGIIASRCYSVTLYISFTASSGFTGAHSELQTGSKGFIFTKALDDLHRWRQLALHPSPRGDTIKPFAFRSGGLRPGLNCHDAQGPGATVTHTLQVTRRP